MEGGRPQIRVINERRHAQAATCTVGNAGCSLLTDGIEAAHTVVQNSCSRTDPVKETPGHWFVTTVPVNLPVVVLRTRFERA